MKKLSYEQLDSKRPSLSALTHKDRFPIYAVLEDIRSMYNVGSIFRTSDAARIEKLFLCGYTAYPPRKEIDKTALGATESVPWHHHEMAVEIVDSLKKENVTIIALEHTDQSKDLYHTDLPFPAAVVFGNEINGLSPAILELADIALEIPMYGMKHSLNVSVAYGIVIYELLRKYRHQKVAPGHTGVTVT